MSRIRTIKPDFWSSEQVMSVSMQARLLFIGIWNFADDAGRFRWKPATLKAQILPGDDVTSAQVSGWLDELAGVGLLQRYSRATPGLVEEFGFVTGWRHQSIKNPSQSRYPEPGASLTVSPVLPQPYPSPTPTLTHGSSPLGSSGILPKGKGSASARDPHPSAFQTEQSPERSPAPVGRPQTTSQGLPSSDREDSHGAPATATRDGFPADGWTPVAQRNAFVAAYERAKCTTPAMGGKSVGAFHSQVVRTAELQKRDPRELFAEALSKWLDGEHDSVARRAPYACFAAAWGDLTAPREKPKAEAPTGGSMPYHEQFTGHRWQEEDRRRAKERSGRRGGEPEALGDIASQLFLGAQKGGNDA